LSGQSHLTRDMILEMIFPLRDDAIRRPARGSRLMQAN
jgi:hypothetical protein